MQVRHTAVSTGLGTLFAALLLAAPFQLDGKAATKIPRAPIPPEMETQVLVLGTDHLAALGGDFSTSLVSGLLDALEDFAPDAVAVEALPPGELARLTWEANEEQDSVAAQLLAAFGSDAAGLGNAAQSELGLSWLQARAGLDSLALGAGHGEQDADERALLLLRFLAAYDVPSALLQWSYLCESDKECKPPLPEEIVSGLSSWMTSPNEIVTLGVALAHRLGLAHLYSVDDHTDDRVGLETGVFTVLSEELVGNPAFEAFAESDYMKDAQTRLAEAAETGDLLDLYARLNSEESGARDVVEQWHLFYRTNLESEADRTRVALWEARNLHIAGNIREVCSLYPGGRVLVIMGAAHKPFLDAYLSEMMDARMVGLDELLDQER